MIAKLGENVFVTGANRGIGLGLVREILKTSAVKNLFAGCREPNNAKDLKVLAEKNGAVKLVRIDVTSDESIRRAIAEVKRHLGSNEGINLLINNSGILEKEGVTLQNPDRHVYLRHFDVNAVGAVMVTAALLPLLKQSASSGQIARVVNIASILASISKMRPVEYVPNKNVVYGMSKASLNHFTKALAMDEQDIVTVGIHPGWVRTDMGGQNATVSVEDSAAGIVRRISLLQKEDSGKFIDHEKELSP